MITMMIYLYCGTHTKGVPCSIMDKNESDAPKPNQESINIWVQNIAKYAKNDAGAFSISFL